MATRPASNVSPERASQMRDTGTPPTAARGTSGKPLLGGRVSGFEHNTRLQGPQNLMLAYRKAERTPGVASGWGCARGLAMSADWDVEAADVIADCMRAVRSEQQVQFAFVTVSHDHEFTAFDRDQPGMPNGRGAVKGALVPDRGVIVEIGRNTRLVNVTGPSLTKRPGAPIPRPILVSLHPRSDYGDRHYLAEQVLRFTSLSWRSLLPSREPVTISYSEMIARELTRLREIPGWNIEKLNSSLRTSCWFL